MSDGKRNKKYNNKKDKQRPVILSKRDGKDDKPSRKNPAEEKVQPKILMKVREKEPTPAPAPAPIVIATRETHEASSSHSPSNISIQSKEREVGPSPVATISEHSTPSVPQMTRPVPLISSAVYQINQNAQKMLMKANTDFFVVGVIGTQGVGKSTIMNLLARDEIYKRTDIYNYFFKEKEGIFPTKSKGGKISTCPHTESVQMFITNDRMIVLDCPPVLCNSYRKDATSNEIDDIKLLIFLLTACHLVIVVQDDYFNVNLIRLIQFAELAKPSLDSKGFVSDYFPNVLFVKNYARRVDFLASAKLKAEKMYRDLFKQSQLKIFVGQSDKQKKARQGDDEKSVNYFLMPEVLDAELNAYHPSLDVLVTDLRNRVFMSPRNEIYNGSSDLTEGLWFDLIASVTANKSNFFLTTYEEIRRHPTQGGGEQGSKSSAMGFVDDD